MDKLRVYLSFRNRFLNVSKRLIFWIREFTVDRESTSDSIIEKTINMFLYTIYRSTLKTVGVIGWTVGLATLTKSHRITIDKREMKMAPQAPENLGF